MQNVKTYVELNIAAHCKRSCNLLRVWYLIRYCAQSSNHVSLRVLRSVCEMRGLMQWPALRAVLADGHGEWWTLTATGDIFYKSRDRLAQLLDAGPVKHSFHIPLDTFSSISKVRGAFVRSCLSIGTGTKQISQTTLANWTGRSRRSIQTYLQEVKRDHNVYPSKALTAAWPHLTDQERKQYQSEGWYKSQIKGQDAIVHSLPCTYYMPQQAKRARPRASARLSSEGRPGALTKRYYTDAREAAKALQTGNEGDSIYYRTGDKDIFNARVWVQQTVIGGTVLSC